MEKKIERVGEHDQAEIVDSEDINGRMMIRCNKCHTYAHAFEEKTAINDLGKTACAPDCQNCNALRRSFDERPAVPKGGDINDKLHICPRDGNKWWQSNSHFRLWQQVTSPSEWETLNKEY